MPDIPWANGGGSTRTLWSDPSGDRRISVAMRERPAPFSMLPGMARLLVVLDPIVVELAVRGDRRTLRQHDMIAFAGDDPVALVALDRPGRVLNLMGRADRWTPSIGRSALPPAPIGWVAWDDGIAARSGDLVLDARAPPRATAIHFLEVDRTLHVP